MKNEIKSGADTTTDEKKKKAIESLDDLIEVIEGDELRHVIGGGRPKTGPFAAA